jgi:LysR family transcriptional regulator, regulator of peptidoglycan recycling
MATPGFAETSAFVAVVEQKSFTKAAKQLGLSPPRVSEMVRQLEERLGVRLVERTTRSVAATVAGERLLERLRPVLAEYQAAFEATDEFRSKPAGLLRLTVAPPAADFVLAPAIARFLALYPEITLDISVDGALTDIVAGRFDAGIRAGERVARDMIALRVSDEIRSVVVAAPAYLKRRGEPKTPQELAAHDCIRLRLPSGTFFPWRFRINRRVIEVHVEGPLIANGSTIPLQAALDGVGLIQLPYAYVATELAPGRLVIALDQFAPPPSDGFFLYYPSRRQTRAALKALVDFLRDARRGGPAKASPAVSKEPSLRPLSL